MNTITIPTDSVLITTVLDNTDCVDFGHDTPTPVTRLAGVTARTADAVTVDLDELVRRALWDNDNADICLSDHLSHRDHDLARTHKRISSMGHQHVV